MPLNEAQIAWLADKLGIDPKILAGTGPQARAAGRTSDILDEFVERQTMYGQQQQDAPDGMPDPDLNEPGRMPELDQGPEPVDRLVRMRDIKYTQKDVSPRMGDGRPIDDISDRMQQDGWDPASPDPDMVQNPDGESATTLDHRRLVAAEHAGIDEVPAKMHGPDELLPEEMEGRFELEKNFTDPESGITYKKGTVAETWGEAARFRAANQGAEFPAGGDARQPFLRPDKAAPPPPGPEGPTLSQRAEAEMRKFEADNPAAREVTADFDRAEAARTADLEGPAEPVSEPAPARPAPAEAPAARAPATAPAAEPVPVEAAPAVKPPVVEAPVVEAPVVEVPGTTAPAAAADAEAAAAGAEGGVGSAVKGGLLGAGIAAGIQVAQDWNKVKTGEMSVTDAAVDVGGKAAEVGGLTFAGTAAADALVGGAGAEASAAAGAGARIVAGAAGAEGGAVAAGASSLASVASKGGVIGGVVAGGMALYDDIGKVGSGEMTAGTATVDVTAKTAVGVAAGMAGAAAGAEIGAIVGTAIPIPIVGTAVGFVAGAVIGGAVGYVGNALMNTETGKEILSAAGDAVDTAIDGVESAAGAVADAGKAVAGGVADAAGAVADAAGAAESAVEDAASSVADAAGGLFDSIVDAVTD